MKKKTPAVENKLPLWLLAAVALVESGLAVYQWLELLKVRSGGSATCALNETVNCETVWNSAFASKVHSLLGMPVAALGVVWGLTALGLCLWLLKKANSQSLVLAVRLWALLGVLSCVSFAIDSLSSKAVCLTCLSTYALVVVFSVGAFRFLPGPFQLSTSLLWPALQPLVTVLAPVFLVLLYPGLKTPTSKGTALPKAVATSTVLTPTPEPARPPNTALMSAEQVQLVEFFNRLSSPERQALADSLAMYKEAEAIDVSSFPIRARFGSMMAPTRMVEFTDMLCGHCAALANTVKELKRALPDGLLSIEARQYPLDGECNPQVVRTDGSGTRCMAAKAQICLENAPDFWELREKLFEAQRTLTKDSVLSIASSGSVSKEALVRCIESPETRQKLAEDIAYATRFGIQGTPLVLLNGKQGTPMGAFLYAMALSRAEVNAPAFGTLPPAQPHAAHDGHGH